MKQGHTSCPVCPSSDAFYRWADGHGHCFSCGYHEDKSKTVEGMKAKLNKVKETSSELSLDEYVYSIPTVGMQWLLKYDITRQEILRHKLMWNTRMESLAFPIISDDKIVATNERYFGPKKDYPKYITRGRPHKNLPIILGKSSSKIILVEDFVSAIKVSRIYDSMPLIGANVPPSTITTLFKLDYNSVIIWLDRNKAKESLKFKQKLSQFLDDVRCCITELDPKEYSTKEIKEYLNAGISQECG